MYFLKRIINYNSQLISLIFFILIWQLISLFVNNSIVLPQPVNVAQAGYKLLISGELIGHSSVSLYRVLFGYLLAIVVAIPLGCAMGINKNINRIVTPIVELLRPIAAIAWVPILLILVGIGNVLCVSIVFYASFFPILLNTVAGVNNCDKLYEQAAQTMGASKLMIVFEVLIPSALSMIFTGLRVGIATAWMSIVAAELIGSSQGIGYMMVWYQGFMGTKEVMVGMVVIGIIGMILNALIRLLEQVFIPWQKGLKIE